MIIMNYNPDIKVFRYAVFFFHNNVKLKVVFCSLAEFQISNFNRFNENL